MSTQDEPSELHKTALAFIEGFNKWTIESVTHYRAPNCTHQVLPDSMGYSQMDNSGYIAHFHNIRPLIKWFKFSALDIVEDEKNKKVALHCKSEADFANMPYANEYVFILQMTGDGKKVVGIKEFIDSAYTTQVFERVKRDTDVKRILGKE